MPQPLNASAHQRGLIRERGFGRICYFFLRFGLAIIRLLFFFLLILSFYPLVHLTDLSMRRKKWQRLHWRAGAVWSRSFCTLFCRLFGVLIERQGNIPEAGSLIVANHRSYLDIAVLGALTHCFFLAKAQVARWPLLGSGARAVGTLFVERSEASSRKQALAAMEERLASGLTLVNFPEGTTSANVLPLPFRPGLFHRLAGTSITIYPTTIHYDHQGVEWIGDATFLFHLFRLAMRRSQPVRIMFSKPIVASRWLTGDELCELCYLRVCTPLKDDPHRREAGSMNDK
jgi:1-acyl-sn-glycerol-3-phosphate acyltransferase